MRIDIEGLGVQGGLVETMPVAVLCDGDLDMVGGGWGLIQPDSATTHP